jgi:threonine/homoserine/homoserine lactone efflux protein
MARDYLVLVLTALAIMGSPGPATISLTAAGAAYGVRRSAGYLAGIIAGTWVVLVAVATGVTAVLLSVPGVRPVLLAASVAYLLWLAYHLARAPALSSDPSVAVPSSGWGGLLLGVANPKAWVAIAAVFAGSRVVDGAARTAVATGLLAVLVVVINASWLLAGASLAPLLRDPRRSRWVNLALAALLVVATAATVVE